MNRLQFITTLLCIPKAVKDVFRKKENVHKGVIITLDGNVIGKIVQENQEQICSRIEKACKDYNEKLFKSMDHEILYGTDDQKNAPMGLIPSEPFEIDIEFDNDY